MNKLTLVALAALALVSACADRPAPTEASIDPGYALYRRVVLGDMSVAVPAKANNANAELADPGSRQVPGSYARYLMHNGWSEREALVQAQTIGEQPRLVGTEARSSPMQFSRYERYQRAVLGASEHEILRGRRGNPPADSGITKVAAPTSQ